MIGANFCSAALLIALAAAPSIAGGSPCDSLEWWEKYEGTSWEGAWSGVGGQGAGPIKVSLSCLYAPQQARYEVVDADPTRKIYRWTSRVAFKDSPTTLVFTPPTGFPRVDTYALGSDGKTLRGDYTFEGEPRGKVSLSLKGGPTTYVYLQSIAPLEGLTFEGTWRSQKADWSFFSGKRVVRFFPGGVEMIAYNEAGTPWPSWLPRVNLREGVLRFETDSAIEVTRLRQEDNTLVLEGLTFEWKKKTYTRSFTVRAPATPEQLSRLSQGR